MRFVLNLVGGLILAIALVFAVADIARSLADGATRLTSIGEAFAALGLPLGGAPAGLSANAVDLIALVANWSASITLGSAAFVLLFVGRPPHRGGRRFAR